MDASQLEEYFQTKWIPRKSLTKYRFEFDKFLSFVEKNFDDTRINEAKIRAYVVHYCVSLKRKESSVKTYISIIKANCKKNGQSFSCNFWKEIYRFIKEETKGVQKKQAPMFEKKQHK